MTGDGEDLQRQQDKLQQDADSVEHDLRLNELLLGVGRPVRVGSSALGLMVKRDLDITVVCPRLELTEVADLGLPLARHPRIRQVLFRNDTGPWNTDPAYPDGLYIGLGYRSASGDDWNVDIWFVDEPERQPDLAHLRSIPPQLNTQTRLAILSIKTMWASRPEYGRTVKSFDVYTAVLAGGIQTVDQFDEWLVDRQHLP